MRDPTVIKDEFTARVLTFLEENWNSSYTVKELARELYALNSRQKLQDSIGSLVKRGFIKARSRDGETAYQVVPSKPKDKPPA